MQTLTKPNNHSARNIDMTQGDPIRLIISFTIPVFLGLIFQNFYNIMDTAIAGNVLGDNALAAIGATGSAYNMLISAANGLNTGFAIYTARAFGSHNQSELNRAIAWTLVLNVLIITAATVSALLFLDPILQIINTPENIYEDARLYLLIIFSGIPITVTYNAESSVMRAMGNSRTPLVCLIISSLLNVGLNLLFAAVLHWGITGIALATLIAQLVSVIYCLIYSIRNYPEIKLTPGCLKGQLSYARNIFVMGLSVGINSIIITTGSAILQSAVNTLGSSYIAGQIGGSKIEILFVSFSNSAAGTMSTYTGQNYGAGKKERIRSGITAVLRICAVVYFFCVLFALSPLVQVLMRLITGSSEPDVINSGALFIRCTLLTSIFMSVLQTFRGVLLGLGHKTAPLMSSGFEMVEKLIFANFLVPTLGYTAVCFCEPSAWILCGGFLTLVMFRNRREFI